MDTALPTGDYLDWTNREIKSIRITQIILMKLSGKEFLFSTIDDAIAEPWFDISIGFDDPDVLHPHKIAGYKRLFVKDNRHVGDRVHDLATTRQTHKRSPSFGDVKLTDVQKTRIKEAIFAFINSV